MSYKSYIPNAITALRFIASPLFFYTFINNLFLLSLSILVLAFLTDAFDGYIARKTGATSDTGAYLDVTADFVLIITCFSAYVLMGWYDPLILILIITMFGLFIGTSSIKKPVYDPVGKYIGAYLMFMVFISLLFPETLVTQILLMILILFSIISVISRLFFIRRSQAFP